MGKPKWQRQRAKTARKRARVRRGRKAQSWRRGQEAEGSQGWVLPPVLARMAKEMGVPLG